MAEIYSKSCRAEGEEHARERIDFILRRSGVIPMDKQIGIRAGEIHVEGGKRDFGLADALILASAESRELDVLSFDPHIERPGEKSPS